jgi:Fic family protein
MSLEEIRRFLMKNKSIFITYMCSDEYEENFNIEYTYNSNAIEGNKMTKEDIILLLKNKQIKKNTDLNSIFETVNHLKVFEEVKEYAKHKMALSEDMVKDFHHQLMSNIIKGGFYRNHDVIISGARHKPPRPNQLYSQIKYFFETLSQKEKEMDPIELAAYTHAEFVKIHPFTDGNGRTSRLIMNYQLIKKGYLPVIIPKESKLEYFICLEEYANNNNLRPFVKFISNLEIKELETCKKRHHEGRKL